MRRLLKRVVIFLSHQIVCDSKIHQLLGGGGGTWEKGDVKMYLLKKLTVIILSRKVVTSDSVHNLLGGNGGT